MCDLDVSAGVQHVCVLAEGGAGSGPEPHPELGVEQLDAAAGGVLAVPRKEVRAAPPAR